MRGDLIIARATPGDAGAIAAIYAHHVMHGIASWEIRPPDVAEMKARLIRVLDAGWPWLVARDASGAVVGYASAAQFHARSGYRYTCEDSIYVAHERVGQGIGAQLLAALIEASEASGFRQMIAMIAGSEQASIRLHARFGFVEAGRLPAVGRKHGQWLDLVYMQRALGEGAATPPGEEPQ